MESIKMISEHLVKSHKDKDDDSLFCRFGELLGYVSDLEISYDATWNSYLKALERDRND